MTQYGRKGEVLWLPPVSTIDDMVAKPNLKYWYGAHGTELANQMRDEAAQIGTDAHSAIERICSGEHITAPEWDKYPEQVKNSIRAFLRWMQEVRYQPFTTELTVYSLKYGYAGTLDGLGYIQYNGKPMFILADWKTSGRFYKVMFLQLAAYRQAYRETYGEHKIHECRCVRLDKDTGIPEEHILAGTEITRAFRAFCSILYAWKYLKGDIFSGA